MSNIGKIQDISWKQLCEHKENEYIIIDVRDNASFEFGNIPGSVNIESSSLMKDLDVLPKEKMIIVACKSGLVSKDISIQLREQGFDAYNLTGGYHAWLIENMQSTSIFTQDIEKSLRKKFHKTIFSKFTKAINKYDLIQKGDVIAVCISGGKDSMLMAKLFQELKRHNKFQFEVKFLVMDPGYHTRNRKIIEDNASLLGIPVTIFETDIFEAVFTIDKSPCYLCARMRRGHLYKKAQELGCNKIALGHHYDDVIETILMGMLYGAQIQTMMPKLHSTNFEGMELIRPMYLIREEDIKHWRDYNNLHFIQCACKFTDTCTTCNSGVTGSKRQEIKELIKQIKETNPYVESNIFNSVENVNIDTVIEYKMKGKKHSFLEDY